MAQALRRLPAFFLCFALFSACIYLCFQSLVPRQHLFFTLFTVLYATFANVYVRRTFPYLIPPQSPLSSSSVAPSSSSSSSAPPSVSPLRKSVRLLFPFTISFSLFAPSAILYWSSLYGVTPPNSEIHRIVTPNLFLTMAQILSETGAFLFSPFFTVYVRFGITTAFVSYRLSALLKWYSDASKWAVSKEAQSLPPLLVALVKATSLLNIVFWSFALLCFLLLYCTPPLVNVNFDEEPRDVVRQTESRMDTK